MLIPGWLAPILDSQGENATSILRSPTIHAAVQTICANNLVGDDAAKFLWGIVVSQEVSKTKILEELVRCEERRPRVFQITAPIKSSS